MPAEQPPRFESARKILTVFAVGPVIAFGVATAYTTPDRAALVAMGAAPRATLDAPVHGPAVYRGELIGPPARVTPTGHPAALVAWQADIRPGKHWSTACGRLEADGLALAADGRHAPLAFLEGTTEVTILDGWESTEWEHPRMVDLGARPPMETPALPAVARPCVADQPRVTARRYVERRLPAGTTVEVLACYADGALRACDGPVEAVLSVEGLEAHRARRAEEAISMFRVAAALVFFLVLAPLMLTGSVLLAVEHGGLRLKRGPR